MKVKKLKESFNPLQLTLETQEEVDALHAVFNHGTLRSRLKLPSNSHELLSRYRNVENCKELHKQIQELNT